MPLAHQAEDEETERVARRVDDLRDVVDDPVDDAAPVGRGTDGLG